MDKKTILAVVLSVVVLSGGMFLDNLFFAEKRAEVPVAEVATLESAPVEDSSVAKPAEEDIAEKAEHPTLVRDPNLRQRDVVVQTDLFEATFSNRGAVLTSLKLKEHSDEGEPLEMIFKGETDQNAFGVSLGGKNGPELDDLYEVKVIDENSVEFSQQFPAKDGVPFILRKTFRFYPGEYLFDLKITVENTVSDYLSLDYDGYSYTLSTVPQIGPEFESVDGRYSYRRINYLKDGKFKKASRKNDFSEVITDRVGWASISGRYFSLVAVPGAAQYAVNMDQGPVEGLNLSSNVSFSRPSVNSARQEDLFRIYAGPKLEKYLNRYDDSDDNTIGVSGMELGKVQDRSSMLGWLEAALKWLLGLFYKIIPNYGVAIILLTILIKIVLFPITRKSYQSTSKMQALSPKMTELREKYKDNPQKLNAEMAELYKKEGVNPMGGCLPMLLQMPVFFALYGLLLKHFELRGAPFVLWINDLSVGDSIYHFSNFTVPLLGWTDIRILPVLFVGTQILSSKIMQTPDNSNKQMQTMMLVMPLIFFFILYNAPSGLLLYWTVTNVLTAIQQKAIARHTAHQKEVEVSKPQVKKGKRR